MELPNRPFDRRDQDGCRTGPGRPERGEQVPADDGGGPQVDVEGGVPDGVVDVVDGRRPGHAGGMDETAERAECGGRLATAPAMAAESATSTTAAWAATPRSRQRAAVSSAPAAVDVPHGHRPPDLGQGQRGGPADARSPAGDEDAGAGSPSRPEDGLSDGVADWSDGR